MLSELAKLYLFTTFHIKIDEANAALHDAGFSNIVKFKQVIHKDQIPIMGTGKVAYRILEEELAE